MAIGHELEQVLSTSLERNVEDRDFVLVSSAHRKLRTLVLQEYPNDVSKQEAAMIGLSPIVDWLIKPHTIDQFQDVKMSTLELYEARNS